MFVERELQTPRWEQPGAGGAGAGGAAAVEVQILADNLECHLTNALLLENGKQKHWNVKLFLNKEKRNVKSMFRCLLCVSVGSPRILKADYSLLGKVGDSSSFQNSLDCNSLEYLW